MSTLKVNTIRHTGASSDAVTLASDGSCTAKITNPPPGNRNLIINGGMTINQRNGTYTAGDYCLDRYRADETTDGAVSITHSGVVPDGFANSLRVAVTTADTSLSGTQYVDLYQYIEAQNLRQLAYGTSSAKTMVLSFYVRSNKTGNYGVTLWQNDNSNKQLSLQYTINSADTWERKTLTIPADTSGVINNDNGKGLTIYWILASGTTYTSGSPHTSWTTYANSDFAAGQEVNLMDSTSNDWYITGVQLEVGDVATDFEHRSYGDELHRCQRYYYLLLQAGTDATYVTDAYMYKADALRANINFHPEMRTEPTLDCVDSSGTYKFYRNGTSDSFDNFLLSSAGSGRCSHLYNDDDVAGTAGWAGGVYVGGSHDGQIGFSAEL